MSGRCTARLSTIHCLAPSSEESLGRRSSVKTKIDVACAFEPEAQHATPPASKSIEERSQISTNIHQHPPTIYLPSLICTSELLELLVSNPIKIGYSFDLKE